MKKYSGWLFAACSILLFSTNTPVVRDVVREGFHPITLAMTRFVGASFLFGAVFAFTPLAKPKGDELPLDRRIIWICLISGAINGLTLVGWNTSMVYLDASIASVMGIALFPSFTLILVALAGEKLTAKKILRLLIVIVGLYFLIGFEGEINVQGVLYVLLAASTYAVHIVMVQWYTKPYNTWATTAIMVAGSAVFTVIIWLLIGRPLFPPNTKNYLVIIYQIVIITFVARTVLYSAIERIGSAQYALLSPVETLLTIMWSFLFLGERFQSVQWLGAGLILTSALLAADFSHRRKKAALADA